MYNGATISSYHIKHCSMIFTLLPTCAPIFTFSGTLPVTSPLRAAAIGARSTRTSIFVICASAVTTIRTFPSANLCLDWRFTRLCTFSYSYGQKLKARVTRRFFSGYKSTLLCLLGLMISIHKREGEGENLLDPFGFFPHENRGWTPDSSWESTFL